MNSVGVLPIELLAADDRQKAVLMYQNAKQILAQLTRKADILLSYICTHCPCIKPFTLTSDPHTLPHYLFLDLAWLDLI
jgi:hypothetical protein